MKHNRTRSLLIAVAILAVGFVVLGVTAVYAQGQGQSPCTPGSNGWSGHMGNRGGMMGQNSAPSAQNCSGTGGMMGGNSMMGGMMNMMHNMMGGGSMMGNSNLGPGQGMMGVWTPPTDLLPAAGKPLTLEKSTAIAKAYIAAWKNKTALKLTEVMQFNDNFYAVAVEADSGRGAFEFLIDPETGIVQLEHGPNMMWNARYGMMSSMGGMMGMMGGSTQTQDGVKMTVSPEQAIKNAQAYLDKSLPGAKIEDKALAFYGYYTIDYLRDNKIAGMLSVNGYTGQVWLHTWHGNFVAETELEAK